MSAVSIAGRGASRSDVRLRAEPPEAAVGEGIAAVGVSHVFANRLHALADISVRIAPGEFVSLVGPSGCGKTTLLNLFAGLLPLQRGQIDLAGHPPAAGRRDVAYRLARDGLFPWRSALANAQLGAEIRGVPKPEREARARQLLEAVGLGGFERAFPKALSQGMRQRVALARTFCLDSRVLLMDEPFGALDAQTKLQLEDVLLSLWNDERRTVVFVTHDLSEAVVLSDRVLVMAARPGRIIADVTVPLARPRSVKALQRDPVYHQIYSDIWSKLEEGLSL